MSDRIVENFSKSKRRSYAILDLINAVFLGLETVDYDLIASGAVNNIIKKTEQMKKEIIGQEVLRLPEKKYKQYVRLLDRLKKELNRLFPEVNINPFVITCTLFHLIEVQKKNIPENNIKLKESWDNFTDDFLDLFLSLQDTEPKERQKANWQCHYSMKGEWMGKKFLKIIEQ